MFNSSNDRTGLCTFIFEDGRHCNMPHTQGDLRLCFFHEQREVRRRFAVDAGAKIGCYLATNHDSARRHSTSSTSHHTHQSQLYCLKGKRKTYRVPVGWTGAGAGVPPGLPGKLVVGRLGLAASGNLPAVSITCCAK